MCGSDAAVPIHQPGMLRDSVCRDPSCACADNEFNTTITNLLDDSARLSWAASLHTADAGIALDHPLTFNLSAGTDRIVQFTSFYHAKESGNDFPKGFVFLHRHC